MRPWQPLTVLDRLVVSDEPSIRLKARTAVLREQVAPDLLEEVRSSARVQAILSSREPDGAVRLHPYAKWRGAHWLLAILAELGYPPGDESLVPLREQVLGWLLSPAYEKRWTPRRHGLCRLHASQDANAVWYLLKLQLADGRVERLTERLLSAQWPDGGWNCDPRPSARVSSFEETLIPLRALALFAAHTSSSEVREAVDRTAEIFLSRRLYRRRSDDRPIADRFLRPAFPSYWHYDILFGLKVLSEAGYIHDERCGDALDLLETKWLADGGFPAEVRSYRAPTARTNASPVDWGGTSRRRSNEWVTVDAFAVLAASNRLSGSPRAHPDLA
jgi:hypothetical protein